MRITIVYRYFWPDTPPYAIMLKEMATWFVEAGHQVRVITAQPSYKPKANITKQSAREVIDGIEIIRLPLFKEKGFGIVKVLNSMLFVAQAFFKVLFGAKSDLLWTATMPPVFQASAISFAAKLRGSKFLYHMQDIYPELGVNSGTLSSGLLAKTMLAFDKHTLRTSHAAVVLSEDMKHAIAERGLAKNTATVLHNFSCNDAAAADVPLASAPGTDEPVRFVFAGNIGRFQNLEALVEAFKMVQNKGIVLELVGEGRVKDALVELTRKDGIENVTFHKHMSADAAFRFMCSCHVGVVSLTPGIYKYAFPSKVLTYMAANLPMIAMIEDESRLAGLLHEENLGTSITWGKSKQELAEAILRSAHDARIGGMRPADATHIYHGDVARKNWIGLLAKLDEKQSAR